MNTQVKNTEKSSSEKKRLKKPNTYDVLVFKRNGTPRPRSFSINSGKIKLLLFLLFLLIISIPINIYFLHYQYNRIAALSSEIEVLLANSKPSVGISSANERNTKLATIQPAENNLKSPTLSTSLAIATPDKQSTGTNIENSVLTDNISNKPSDPSISIAVANGETVVQTMPSVIHSDKIVETSIEEHYLPEEATATSSQNQTAETEQQQDQASASVQAQQLEHAVIIDNIYHKLTQNKLSIAFDIVNKGRGQKNGYVCMIIYSNEEDKSSYIVHPERVEIDNSGNPLSYKRGLPFSIYSFRHINADIDVFFTTPFSIKFLVYNNNGNITYDKTIDVTL